MACPQVFLCNKQALTAVCLSLLCQMVAFVLGCQRLRDYLKGLLLSNFHYPLRDYLFTGGRMCPQLGDGMRAGLE